MLPVDPNFERVNDAHTTKQRLNIHDIQIEDPFTMKTKNDFIDSPLFGLYDIFNLLIYHATDYDKQGPAAYKSFEDYRLFQDGYYNIHHLFNRNCDFNQTRFQIAIYTYARLLLSCKYFFIAATLIALKSVFCPPDIIFVVNNEPTCKLFLFSKETVVKF